MPTTPPLLALAEHLANRLLEAQPQSALSGLHITAEQATLLARLKLPGLGQGVYPFVLRLEATSTSESRFSLHFDQAGGVGKVLGFGVKMLPEGLINDKLIDALPAQFRHQLRLENGQLVLQHPKP